MPPNDVTTYIRLVSSSKGLVSLFRTYSIDQAVRTWLVAAALPPHSPAEALCHDILCLFLSYLGGVEADHHPLSRVIAVARDCFLHVDDIGTFQRQIFV